MGLLKLILLALAAAFGVAVERLDIVSPAVAAAFVLLVWLALLHDRRNRAN
jgi:hypothetical protein